MIAHVTSARVESVRYALVILSAGNERLKDVPPGLKKSVYGGKAAKLNFATCMLR